KACSKVAKALRAMPTAIARNRITAAAAIWTAIAAVTAMEATGTTDAASHRVIRTAAAKAAAGRSAGSSGGESRGESHSGEGRSESQRGGGESHGGGESRSYGEGRSGGSS